MSISVYRLYICDSCYPRCLKEYKYKLGEPIQNPIRRTRFDRDGYEHECVMWFDSEEQETST